MGQLIWVFFFGFRQDPNTGGLTMNWDQIERKWEEMARRVQPVSSRASANQDKPSTIEPDVVSAQGSSASTDLLATAVADKP